MAVHQGQTRGRPRGSFKEDRRLRKDYRFTPDTLQQIEQGRALVANKNETDFVEQAIAHYVASLTGSFQAQPNTGQEELLHNRIAQLESNQAEIPFLREQVATLQRDLRNAYTALEQAKTTKPGGARAKKAKQDEPKITIGKLIPTGMMGSYQLHYEFDGMEAIPSLDPINEKTAAFGYRFSCHVYSVAHPGPPVTTDRAMSLKKLASDLLIEELQKVGWKPSDPVHPEAQTTVWRYQEATNGD